MNHLKILSEEIVQKALDAGVTLAKIYTSIVEGQEESLNKKAYYKHVVTFSEELIRSRKIMNEDYQNFIEDLLDENLDYQNLQDSHSIEYYEYRKCIYDNLQKLSKLNLISEDDIDELFEKVIMKKLQPKEISSENSLINEYILKYNYNIFTEQLIKKKKILNYDQDDFINDIYIEKPKIADMGTSSTVEKYFYRKKLFDIVLSYCDDIYDECEMIFEDIYLENIPINEIDTSKVLKSYRYTKIFNSLLQADEIYYADYDVFIDDIIKEDPFGKNMLLNSSKTIVKYKNNYISILKQLETELESELQMDIATTE